MATRETLEAAQLVALRRLLAELEHNAFWAPRLRDAGLDRGALAGALPDLATFRERLPTITKDEIVADQRAHPPYGSNLSYPLERYVRLHQTSGTSGGVPLRWLDTAESWSWMLETWIEVFRAAGVDASDRVFFAFSFGPFLGFWTAFDAAQKLGALALPGGVGTSTARLRLLLDNACTTFCATPTYALRLAEVAVAEGIDLTTSSVRAVIVAGEPGGSVPSTRQRIAEAWGATVFDHHGMTEVGPVSVPNPRFPETLHIRETSYLAEVIDAETGAPVAPGESGELVLTTLGRLGSPLLRYRTGDLVRPSTRDVVELGRPDLALEGGILARTDDMVVVRGTNLYPSAVEQVVRGHVEGEYRVELDTRSAMAQIRVLIEDDDVALRRALEDDLRAAFQLRIPVEAVATGSLPRFELKAKRWVRR
ncbi:MAG: AMP-binding protein [Acidobacteriota bacterium]